MVTGRQPCKQVWARPGTQGSATGRATWHYPVLTFRKRLAREWSVVLKFPSQRSFSGLDLECRGPPTVKVGPLETESSRARCCVAHLWPCDPDPCLLSRVCSHYLCHSPQALGGAGTWMRLPCYLQAKSVQTPLRAWMPRESCWPAQYRYLWCIPHHCLGPFRL